MLFYKFEIYIIYVKYNEIIWISCINMFISLQEIFCSTVQNQTIEIDKSKCKKCRPSQTAPSF